MNSTNIGKVSKLNNFFKVILPVLNWCQVTGRRMKSVIVKPIHIIRNE